MKKLLVFLLTLVLFFAAGCAKNENIPGGGEEVDEWGIILGAEHVTSTGMTLICTQSGGHYTGELQTGSPFSLEQEVNGVWLPMDTKSGLLDWAWTMEAWMIRPNDTTKWEVSWEFLYGELGPGVYRMQKEIMNFRSPGDFTEKNYYAEFAIVD